MKVIVDKNINGDTPELKDATKSKPVPVTIVRYELVAAEDLPEQFENREDDRSQVVVTFDGGDKEYTWMPNKTSLKVMVKEWSDESDNWLGKKLGLFAVDANVGGQMKRVVYCTPVAA